jgi:hypothetical protein
MPANHCKDALDPGYAWAAARAKLRGTGAGRMAHVAGMGPRFLGFGALLTFSATAAAFALCDLVACASNDGAGSATDSGLDGGGGHDGAAGDAASGTVDGPGVDGTMCSFNRDCHLALRCECNETTGCACKPGARGAGKNGIDPCTSGNECASSVCVEGPPDAGSFCSDECMTSNDCTGMLPLCSDIAFVGRVCIRTAPQ